MYTRLILAAAVILIFSGCGPSAVENCPPGVICQKITLYNQADPGNENVWFDFSEGRAIIEAEGHKDGDFCLYKTFLRSSWPVECGIQDSQADSLHRRTENPEYDYIFPDENRKNADLAIYSGHVYYFITGEGHYAKLKILNSEWNSDATSYNFLTFEYAYQPNGTKYFGVNPDGTPVKREDVEEAAEETQ
jgi:hypothetical protein